MLRENTFISQAANRVAVKTLHTLARPGLGEVRVVPLEVKVINFSKAISSPMIPLLPRMPEKALPAPSLEDAVSFEVSQLAMALISQFGPRSGSYTEASKLKNNTSDIAFSD
jgi:hypothetical protein